jgi:beta-glucanase (GH16 family)
MTADRARVRKPWFLLTCLATAAALTFAGVFAYSQAREPEPDGALGPNSVVNGQAAEGLAGWRAGSAAGPVQLTRISLTDGPAGASTAVDLQRPAGTGDWAEALAMLNSPDTFLQVGRQYTMQAYVRDADSSGQEIGILLANGNYRDRPTESSNAMTFQDDAWHLLTQTFVATAKASPDTALYIALPPSGPLHLQITAASVREVHTTPPSPTSTPPTRIISFDGPAGSAPDPSTWNHQTGGGGWSHDEHQTYTSSTSNAYLDGHGNLVIAARREDKTGADGILRHYTSARLTSEGLLAVQPGSYLETSIRAPVAPGMWPAFWLLGSNYPDVGWPASGELDVLEAWGDVPNIAHSIVHMPTAGQPTVDAMRGANGATDLGHAVNSQAHTYGVYFDGTVVRFFIDRNPTMTLSAADARASGAVWPFNGAQSILLNVAVDGRQRDAAGSLTATQSSFPQKMTVGPISIWAKGVPF